MIVFNIEINFESELMNHVHLVMMSCVKYDNKILIDITFASGAYNMFIIQAVLFISAALTLRWVWVSG